MTVEEATVFFNSVLDGYQRALTEDQLCVVKDCIERNPYPLFVQLTGAVCQHWTSYQSNKDIKLEGSLENQVDVLFDVQERLHGRQAFAVISLLLAITEQGVSDTEVLHILDKSGTVSKLKSASNFAAAGYIWPVCKDELEPFLITHNVHFTPLYRWSHAVFLTQVLKRYKSKIQSVSKLVLEYFLGEQVLSPTKNGKLIFQFDPSIWKTNTTFDRRRLDEIPCLLYTIKQKELLEKICVNNLHWIARKLETSDVFLTLRDLTMALELNPNNKLAQYVLDFIRDNCGMFMNSGCQFLLQLQQEKYRDVDCKIPRELNGFEASNGGVPILDSFANKEIDKSVGVNVSPDDKPIITGLYRIKHDPEHMLAMCQEEGNIFVINIFSFEVVRTITGLNQPKEAKMFDSFNAVILCNRELRNYNLDKGELVSKLKGVLNIKMPYYDIHTVDQVLALSRNRMCLNMLHRDTGDVVTTFKVTTFLSTCVY